jgi:hypothetical protein
MKRSVIRGGAESLASVLAPHYLSRVLPTSQLMKAAMRAMLFACVSLLLVSCINIENTAPTPAPAKVETALIVATTPTAPQKTPY